jgi:hypothetical protein
MCVESILQLLYFVHICSPIRECTIFNATKAVPEVFSFLCSTTTAVLSVIAFVDANSSSGAIVLLFRR